MSPPVPPPGFAVRELPNGFQWIASGPGRDETHALDLDLRAVVAGLGRGDRRGRGASAVVDLGALGRAFVKQLRRGGLAGRVRGETFAGLRRIVRNVSVPEEARRRGVDTPRPIALEVRNAGVGTYRAWLAVESLEPAHDLAGLAVGAQLDTSTLLHALEVIRRHHDAGLRHPDLNLGNLVGIGRRGPFERVVVVDLDGASMEAGSVGEARRIRELARFERSYLKLCRAAGVPPGDPVARRRSWASAYARGPSDRARRIARGLAWMAATRAWRRVVRWR